MMRKKTLANELDSVPLNTPTLLIKKGEWILTRDSSGKTVGHRKIGFPETLSLKKGAPISRGA